MTNKTKVKLSSTIILLSFLLIGFVNCSQQGFQSKVTQQVSLSSVSNIEDAVVPSSPIPAIPAPTPPPPSLGLGKVDVFLAHGKIARTIMSCDDGLTWINNQSDNDNARCWISGDPNYVECDHDTRSATGLDVSDDGWFYAQYGWGFNGTIRRSRNGLNWQVVRSGGWGGGLAVANNKVFQIWESGWAGSADQGQTWQQITKLNYGHAFVYRAGQKLISRGRGLGQLAVSLDSGITWKQATSFRPEWGSSFAEGNGLIISIGQLDVQGSPTLSYVGRSSDNGVTWTALQVFDNHGWSSNLIFNGTDFVAWAGGKKWQSKDGLNWTSTPYFIQQAPPGHWTGAFSFNQRTGTYVSISNGWGSWYQNQSALRSTDGINWSKLDATKFQGGHPIVKVVMGQIDASACGK